MGRAFTKAEATELSVRQPRSRLKFDAKRERILDAATVLINEGGLKGMTLRDVSAAVDLNTTSITYYFKRKELLAAAVFESTLGKLEDMVREAAAEQSPRARVARFVATSVDLRVKAIRGTGLPLAKLSDVRALEDEYRLPLVEHYKAIFREIRGFFGEIRSERHKALLTARAHILLEVVFWLPVWISQYPIAEIPRVTARLIDLLWNGIAGETQVWKPSVVDIGDEEGDASRLGEGPSNFLRVATKLINNSGYRGASVARIAEELNVTKGSFYHHLDAKDDLIVECFRRSYGRYSRVLSLAEALEPNGWQRLSSAIATLLNVQFYSDWPLLRTSAFQALPTSLRTSVLEKSNRTALRFAGTIIDGIEDGTVRIVDPNIASQLIMATVNVAYDIRSWAHRLPPQTAIDFYAASLVGGLFDDSVLGLEVVG